MSRIILRLLLSAIPPLPVWILTGDLWLGLLVMMLGYIVLQLIQYIAAVKIMTIYDLLSRHFVDENGDKVDVETLQWFVEKDKAFNRKFIKMWRKYL